MFVESLAHFQFATLMSGSNSSLREKAHVKTNLVHQLYNMNTFRTLKLGNFKYLLAKDEYLLYEKQPKPNA
jgi:hypothetical protein